LSVSILRRNINKNEAANTSGKNNAAGLAYKKYFRRSIFFIKISDNKKLNPKKKMFGWSKDFFVVEGLWPLCRGIRKKSRFFSGPSFGRASNNCDGQPGLAGPKKL
jgi:hypothetical protein